MPALIEAIGHRLRGVVRSVELVPVHETFQRRTGVFDLTGHPSASRCYAWSHTTEGPRRRFVAVLHSPPVGPAVDAVRASIVAEANGR